MSARKGLAKHTSEADGPAARLPEPFAGWFASRGWRPRPHQLALLDTVAEGRDTLLIAPTGGGKTLAGFLPSLIDLAARPPSKVPARSVHTLYVSPLKALATDIAAQPRHARGRDGAAHPARDPDRRHAAIAPRAPANIAARDLADHARADRADALP